MGEQKLIISSQHSLPPSSLHHQLLAALSSGVEAEALLFLLLLLDVEHQGHQLVALPLLAFHKVVNELP